MKSPKMLILAALSIASVLVPSACATTAVVVTGQTVGFYVKSCDGTQPFTYQWRKDGVDIPGATGVALPKDKDGVVVTGLANSAYIIASVVPADAGVYTIRVTNPAGSFTTSPGDTLAFVIAPSGAIQGVLVNGVLQQ
jgi:Immunoglobulin I-set domain